jgi:hypothetical protein
MFVADGRLEPEEATILSRLMRRVDPLARTALESRFVEDESDWLVRLAALPDDMRPAFSYALSVGAAVDKHVSLPEQRILARAARALGQPLDMRRVEQMVKDLEEVGVLPPPRP